MTLGRRLRIAAAAVTATAAALAFPGTAGAGPVPLGPNDGWVEGAGSAWQCVINDRHVVCNRQWPGVGGIQTWGTVNIRVPEWCYGMSMASGSFTDRRPAELWLYNPNPNDPRGCSMGQADTVDRGFCAYVQPGDSPGVCHAFAGQNIVDDRWVSMQRVWLGGVRYGLILRLY